MFDDPLVVANAVAVVVLRSSPIAQRPTTMREKTEIKNIHENRIILSSNIQYVSLCRAFYFVLHYFSDSYFLFRFRFN